MRRLSHLVVMVTLLPLIGGCATVSRVFDLRRSDEPAPIKVATQFRVATLDPGLECPDDVTPDEGSTCAQSASTGDTYRLGPARGQGMIVGAEITNSASGCAITLTLDDDDRASLAQLSEKLSGSDELLGVIVDGSLLTAVSVLQPITGGVVEISGDFTQSDCEDLRNTVTG